REVTGIQAPSRAPHAEPVVHQQLDARGARVPKEVAVMRMGSAGCLHDAAHEPFGAGSHVHRRGAQPELINADHLSRPEDSSLNQAVQSLAAEVGQRTLRCSGPRRSCTSMNGAVASSVVRSTEGLAAAESAVVLGCAGISMA